MFGDINKIVPSEGLEEVIIACENGLIFASVDIGEFELKVLEIENEMADKYVVDV